MPLNKKTNRNHFMEKKKLFAFSGGLFWDYWVKPGDLQTDITQASNSERDHIIFIYLKKNPDKTISFCVAAYGAFPFLFFLF